MIWAIGHAVEGADVVINLAGRSVDCRYTEANRQEIMESRVLSTKVVGESIARSAHPPKLWMNASTATIYRHVFDRPMDEATGELGGTEPDAPAAWSFSIEVAKRWEQVFFEAQTPATRKVALRAAMVMGPGRDGIFSTLLNLVRFGLGGNAASGRQFVSWIHETDFLRALEFLMRRQEIQGCVNVCAPAPLPYQDFMRGFRRAYGIPIGLPAAKWMLELGAFFLRTETELVLKSRRVIPGRLLRAGFEFLFPEWPEAAKDLMQSWRLSR